jgi:hypothetical protein
MESSTGPPRRTRLSCLAAGAVLVCVAASPVLRHFLGSVDRFGWGISSAIGNTRMVISAEAAYQSANKGWYDTLECLSRAAQCIPGYGGPPFLNSEFPSKAWGGYVYEFHPGRVAHPAEVAKAGASPSSLEGYALVALPNPRTGDDGATCGNDSGEICTTPTGGRPRVEKGQCVMTPGAPPKRHRWPWSPLPDEEPCYPLR